MIEVQLLTDPLRRAEKLYGDRQAVTCGSTRMTYGQMTARVRRLAGGLRARGIGPGDRVATLMLNCHRYFEAYFAIPGMGAAMVPLNNRHAVPEHRYILSDGGVRALITDDAEVAAALAGVVEHVILAPDELEALIASSPEVSIGTGVREDDLASLFYTGGTTGASKGVMLTHRNLVANALHSQIGLRYDEDTVYLHAAPMFHLADGLSTYALTWVGGRHVFIPSFTPESVLDAIEREGVTHTLIVPVMINALINHPGIEDADVSSLRVIAHGGAPIQTELLRRAVSTLGCSFTQAYGLTETAPLLTLLPHEETLIDDPRLRSCGREIAGVELAVVRPDGTPCEPREVGEIVARGPNIMQGYWNKPTETADALRDGWFWTKDLAYRDEQHYIFIVDRAKDMIISGGENVYCTEVEEAIYQHPAILEAAVIGVPDTTWGERVHAVVVAKPGMSIDPDELKAFCKERIANYKCPRSVEIIDALPKSGAGKIVKTSLREKHWAGIERAVH